ncbi:MAG TPA: hypothetical protein VFS60_19240, partial [Thermoanaerobaculia bacterium]|nr:hypothetical protein [Thermoanaerobaculia bacterium]
RIYDAVNDIVVGVNESRMLRWLIRSRQKKGIKARYEAEGGPPLSKAEEKAPASADPPDSTVAAPPTAAPAPPAATPAPTPPGDGP